MRVRQERVGYNFLIYSPRNTTAEWSGGKSICNGHGKITKRQELWCEAAQTATLLDNILVQDSANVETKIR